MAMNSNGSHPGLPISLSADERSPLLPKDSLGQAKPRKLSSTTKAFGNIVVSIVGSGVLGLPYAFKRSGWLVGGASITIAGASTYYCMMLLVACSRKVRPQHPVRTIGDLGLLALGLPGQLLADFLVLVAQFGCCVAYLIFIAENLATFSHTSRASMVLFVVPFQVLVSWIRTLTGLAPFSILADVFMAAAMAFVMGNDVINGFGALKEVKAVTDFQNFTFVVGVAVYCFEGFAVTQPIEASMKHPEKFGGILGGGLALITLVYSAFAFFGYLAYGEATKDIITLNMGNGWGTVGVKVGLCVGLFFTFPVMMVPVYDVLDRQMMSTKWFDERVNPSPRLRKLCFRAIRTLAVVLAGYVAVSVPGFGVFIALIGCTVSAMLAFVLPALFHIRLSQGHILWWEYFVDIVLIAFGVVFAAVGTWNTLR